MVSRRALRRWRWVHSRSSVICTVFLLVICLTGLPLMFADEIEASGIPAAPGALEPPPRGPRPGLDHLVAEARSRFPTETVTSIVFDEEAHETRIWFAPPSRLQANGPSAAHFVASNAGNGGAVARPAAPSDGTVLFLWTLRRFHIDLFVGLWGELFMASMALSFVLAIVSGVALYGPFTRKLAFGELRSRRTKRIYWLDLHNLLGVATLGWAVVVGCTGVMNELSTVLFARWQQTDVQAVIASYAGRPEIDGAAAVLPQRAFDAARAARPGVAIASLVYPGQRGSTPYHYLLWTKGTTRLTSRLFIPILVDVQTGEVTAVMVMPWYLRALQVSRPLHFGDYGGLPLKIIWALLDVVMIGVLGSGVYLWAARRRDARKPDGGRTRRAKEDAE